MPFSFCIITKNEKENIEKCIKSLISLGQEIVVVDTGSEDGTVDFLQEMSGNNPLIKLFHFTWCDDFSKAKNFAVDNASNEFVCVIDSDEFVENIDVDEIEKLISKNPELVGRIKRHNIFTRNTESKENVEWINRIFSKKLFRYEGRIHEQVTRLDHKSYDTYKTPLCIIHNGYDLTDDQREKKAKRNIDLLEIELESLLAQSKCGDVMELEGCKPDKNSPQAEIPYVLYQLGKGYYMLGDYETAIVYFSKGLIFDLNPRLEYVSDMVEAYGYALINSGKHNEALFFENIYDEFSYTADFHFLMGLIYMKNALFQNAVKEFEKSTEYSEAKMVGVNSYLANYNIGVIYECLGEPVKAQDYYIKCGDYEPAYARLKRFL